MQKDIRVALPFSFYCNSFGRRVNVQPGTLINRSWVRGLTTNI
jgi:hypothetical protein